MIVLISEKSHEAYNKIGIVTMIDEDNMLTISLFDQTVALFHLNHVIELDEISSSDESSDD